jgi:hypothetical protein
MKSIPILLPEKQPQMCIPLKEGGHISSISKGKLTENQTFPVPLG